MIDGKAVAATLRAELAARVAHLSFKPGLAVVLVGDNAASAVYVRAKDRAATEAGFSAATIRLPADTAQAALLGVIAGLNADPTVDGILVQLPLPPQIDAAAVLQAVDPAKDVDGFHPVNVGLLAEGRALLAPCTPRGGIRRPDRGCANARS
jgi:methylenetetrahydrofolate dehydrogenase (NADP+)/methenyltetrahydrofolate cyclohydrolase